MPRRCYEEPAIPSSDPFEKGLFSIWGRQLPILEKENACEPSRFYDSCWLLFGLDGPGSSFLRASSGVLTDISPLLYPQHRQPAQREVGWARLSFLSFPLGLGILGVGIRGSRSSCKAHQCWHQEARWCIWVKQCSLVLSHMVCNPHFTTLDHYMGKLLPPIATLYLFPGSFKKGYDNGINLVRLF